jgi:hypothetical protein
MVVFMKSNAYLVSKKRKPPDDMFGGFLFYDIFIYKI